MTLPVADLLAAPCSALVVGLGRANQAVARALMARGHGVVAVDDRPGEAVRETAAAIGIDLVEAPADIEPLVLAADFVVPAPGLPEWHPVFAAADGAGVPVVSELDLAGVWDDRPVLAVTGTNGKTTVVELAVAAFGKAGIRAMAVGNTDVPMVAAIDDADIDVFVVEASSFRLARVTAFSPTVATWLNFAPDHLDVHRDLAAYEAAKARLFDVVAPGGTVVANRDDAVVMAHVPATGSVVTFGGPGADWYAVDGQLCGPDGAFATADALWRSLPHDIEDALAVAASVVPLGASTEAVASACADFTLAPHRVTPVGAIDGVTYYDDSKATTPHATLAALRGFDQVVLIAGGRNKGLDLSVLADAADRIAAVVAIGEAADEISTAFAATRPVVTAGSMTDAVDEARRLSAGRLAVLLSPACASFDWYGSYGERGDDFSRIVADLAEVPA